MKTQTKTNIEYFALIFVGCLAAIICISGCVAPKQKSDPLAGWNPVGDISYRVNPEGSFLGSDPCSQTIIDDVKRFIHTFPPAQRGAGAGPFQLYEDGTGQHAVGFEVFVGPYTSYRYALFYNKEDKRVKVVKYGETRHMS